MAGLAAGVAVFVLWSVPLWRMIRQKKKDESISVGEQLYQNMPQNVRRFFADGLRRKKAMGIYILCGIFIILFLSAGIYDLCRSVKSVTGITRNPSGQGGQTADLSVSAGDTIQEFHIDIESRQYTEEEVKGILEEAVSYIDANICGENVSLDAVTEALELMTSVPGLPVTIQWISSDYRYVSDTGDIGDISQAVLPIHVMLTGRIVCQGIERTYEVEAALTAPVLSAAEQFYADISTALHAALDRSALEEKIELPEEVSGKALKWFYTYTPLAPQIGLACIPACICLNLCMNEKEKKKIQRRKDALAYDYSSFAHKLVLLRSTGMPVIRVWDKIVNDEKLKRNNPYLWEEMQVCMNQMKNGIPEMKAYMAFARRIGQPSYNRMCSLLVQSIKKGAADMQQIMEEAAEDAEKARCQRARKAGETAATRLLLPMMILFTVIMIIVMVPAFMSM